MDVEPTSSFAYHLRGLTYFGAGEHVKAIVEYVSFLIIHLHSISNVIV